MSHRILHVFDHTLPLQSGYTFRSLSLLREQRKLGWSTFHLSSPKQNSHASLEEVVDDLHFYRTPDVRPSPWPGIAELALMRQLEHRLWQVAQQVRPHVLHAHSSVLNAYPTLRVGKRLGLPVVYEVRAFWEDAAVNHGTTAQGSLRYKLTRAMETRAMQRVAHVFTICEGLRQDMLCRGISADKITVIPNAVDAHTFKPGAVENTALKARLGLQGCSVVGFIGSFYAYEGLDVLLRALPSMLHVLPNLRLLLVGGGPQELELQALCLHLGIEAKVIFAGRVPHDQVASYYDLIDVLAYPRHAMRLTDLVTPLKPLEAMAQGRIFVASDVGGHKELVNKNQADILFKAGSAEALAKLVLALFDARGTWPALRAAGRAYVEKERNWATSVARYKRVYDTLVPP